MSHHSANGYRSAYARALCLSVLIIALVVAQAAMALFLAGEIQLLEATRAGASIPKTLAEAQDSRVRVLAIIESALGLAMGITLLMWVYRANYNARALGAEGMSYSPGWSVAYFLIPCLNLWMPFLVLKELWKASTPGRIAQWRQARVSPVLPIWWAVTLASAFIQYSPWPDIAGRHRLAEVQTVGPRVEDFLENSWGALVAQLVGIASCVLTVVVVMGITNLQERIAAERAEREEQTLVGPEDSIVTPS